MQPIPPSSAASVEPSALSAVETEDLLAGVRQLQQAEAVGATRVLLRGKKLGLVCQSEDVAEAILFRRAASALGASVSHILPSVAEPGDPNAAKLAHTARVLGRLYDGIECQGLATAWVRQLGHDAGVPVFDGLASASHPTAQLAALIEGSEPLERKRQLIVQAALMSVLR